MTVPLMVLALLSIVGGWTGWPASLGGSGRFDRFAGPVIASRVEERAEASGGPAASMEYLLMLVSVAIAVAGILLARYLYLQRTELPGKLAASWPRLYQLLYRKYYVDEIYDAMFVNRAKDLGTTLGAFDDAILSALALNGATWLAPFTSPLSISW